jgi:alpha-L-rhamnosidase
MFLKKITRYKRIKGFTIAFLLSCISMHVLSQEENVDWLTKYWDAYWITMPGKTGKEYGVYHFRKNFKLEEKPGKFIIHISADNRYKLFVNGEPFGYGPAQGMPQNWMYDTYDISTFLKAGDNAIACQVWNYGQYAPWVQMSVKTGFIVQGDSEKEKILNTDESWKVSEDSAYKVFPIDYNKIPDFIIVSPGDIIDANKYPWNWQSTGYNDDGWLAASRIVKGGPYGTGTDLWWQLVPRKSPYLSEDTIRFRNARRISVNINFPKGVLSGKENFIVPANSKVKILLDQEYETTAFPEMVISGGKNATITLSYAESLMYPSREKGNRNDIEGKELYGLSDRFIADGGSNRHFTPLYFRSYRYLELEMETGAEPLTIHDFYARYSFVKHPQAALFETSDTLFNHILQTAWHTQDVCTKDYLLTDAYYEQLQYIGDNHIQALILNSMGYSQDLVKNTIWQYYMSRIPEGLTQSRFPCAVLQVIPTYSLLWISMVKEYWSYYKDDAFVKQMLSATNTILDWYEKRLDPATGLTGKTEFFNFVDWTKEWTWVTGKDIGGVPTGVNTGGSSITTMQFAIALNDAATLFSYYHEPYYAEKYKACRQSR